MAAKRSAVRFNGAKDVALLREVRAQNPFTDTNIWINIAENLSTTIPELKDITARRCRERTKLLLEYYKSEDTDSLKRSGTDEDYTEKDQLLGEINETKNEAETEIANQKKRKIDTARAKAENIRKAAMEGLPNKEDGGQTPKRQRSSVLEYLENKKSSDVDLRRQELELEKEKLNFEKIKFEFDQKQAVERMALERQERMALIQMLMNKNN